MKKIRQILAWIGIILLIAMYVLTLVLAFSGAENWFNMLIASVVASFMIPFVLWWLTRMMQRKKEAEEEE